MLDFHTHTILSDGLLLPAELIQRARHAGYRAVGVTDHVDSGTLHATVAALQRSCQAGKETAGIVAVPGAEITHVLPSQIASMVETLRALDCRLVIVHGETVVEPVLKGTNRAAIDADIDLLAHPGLIDKETILAAKRRDTFLEITARHGHSLTNGLLVALARELDALHLLVVSSDSHGPGDLLSETRQRVVALGAGLSEEEYVRVQENLNRLWRRVT